MDLLGIYLFQLVFVALHEALWAGKDCLIAGDSCSSDEACSPRLRTLRQCVAGNGSMKLGPGARSQCVAAVSALLSSPLHGCQCKRGMKKEKDCLSIYWSLHQSFIHGLNLVKSSPYESAERSYDYVRLASITSDSEAGVTKVNRCLDAAKACNLDSLCLRQRAEYVSACITPTVKNGPCNRANCHKALRKFFDRVPPEFTHEMLFCPCTDANCGERRKQTVVPACSHEQPEKPNCLTLLRNCKADYVCKSRWCQFQHDCEYARTSANGCTRGNYWTCLVAYTGMIGSLITPNYVSNSSYEVAPWCTCPASGSQRQQCSEFLEYFTNNICLENALQAFGNGLDLRPTPSQHEQLSPVTDQDQSISPSTVTVEMTTNLINPFILTQATVKDRLWGAPTLPSGALPMFGPASRQAPIAFTCLLLLFLLCYDP